MSQPFDAQFFAGIRHLDGIFLVNFRSFRRKGLLDESTNLVTDVRRHADIIACGPIGVIADCQAAGSSNNEPKKIPPPEPKEYGPASNAPARHQERHPFKLIFYFRGDRPRSRLILSGPTSTPNPAFSTAAPQAAIPAFTVSCTVLTASSCSLVNLPSNRDSPRILSSAVRRSRDRPACTLRRRIAA